jgi:glycosyltransferase involved in cell wall biosynthesis
MTASTSPATATRISIAVATCNGGAYLAEQLRSFAAQTRPPDEVVVCDDVSTDATAAIVERFKAEVPFDVRFFPNAERLGVIGNFEKAVAACSGDLIFLSDQDDVWLPHKLATHARVHREHPEVGFAFSNAKIVSSTLEDLGDDVFAHRALTPRRIRRIRSGQAFPLLACRPLVHGFTMSLRRSLLEVLLPFPREYLHDRWIAVCLPAFTRTWPIEESLALYRSHGRQTVGLRDSAPPNAEAVKKDIEIELAGLEVTKQRLLAHAARTLDPRYVRVVEGRQAYIRARIPRPSSPPERIWMVARDVLSGRYLRYSAAVKYDVLADLKGHR